MGNELDSIGPESASKFTICRAWVNPRCGVTSRCARPVPTHGVACTRSPQLRDRLPLRAGLGLSICAVGRQPDYCEHRGRLWHGPRRDTDKSGSTAGTSPFRFTEIAQRAGIDFVHFSGMTKDRHFPTANGSGVAIFDYDNDGKLDLYFATATLLPLGTARTEPNRLYRNRGNDRFEDVTEASGLGFAGFCHGIVVGDIDNDGDQDVFLCNYGPNVLFLNNGNGTFKDITNDAGVGCFNWASGGAFLDYDNDGDLDLYVTNYGHWKLPDDDRFCTLNRVRIVRASPRSVPTARPNRLRRLGTSSTGTTGIGPSRTSP